MTNIWSQTEYDYVQKIKLQADTIASLRKEIEELKEDRRKWYDRYAILYAWRGSPNPDTEHIFKQWACEVDDEYRT